VRTASVGGPLLIFPLATEKARSICADIRTF
jgi:hypothetical protein